MIVAHTEIKILDIIEAVTDGTISMIQSTTDDSLKKQLIDRYCGRLSTWEASWKSAFNEEHNVSGVASKHSDHSFSADSDSDLIKTSLVSSRGNTPTTSSDRNRKSVSAINKVLERYNLTRKRSVH